MAERGPTAHSFQKITIVGNGLLNQQGLTPILAPMRSARNRQREIV
jgi:hypothetical protein